MSKIYYFLIMLSLVLVACEKQNEEPNDESKTELPKPELPKPEEPKLEKPKPEEPVLVGEWRQVRLEENGYEIKLENCNRKSSLVFGADQTATRTTYQYTPNTDPNDAKDACSYVVEAKTYTTTLQQLVLQSVASPTDTEAYTYSVTTDTLVMVYTNRAGGVQTITYRKNYQYDPAKEIIGTWYIHSLWRNDIYNYDKDLTDFDGCRSQQKVVITKDSITMYQYRYTKNKCRETVYKGAYEISAGLGIIKVRNKIRGKVNVGLREFRLGNGTLEFWGFVNGLAGDYENEFYRKEKTFE